MNSDIGSDHELFSDNDSNNSLWGNAEFSNATKFPFIKKLDRDNSYEQIFIPGLSFPKIKANNCESNLNTANKIESCFIKDLNTLFSQDDKIISDKVSSSLIEEKLQFNSPICNSEYWLKLNVGRTPFTEKFQNSPLCKPSYNFRNNTLFGSKILLDDIQDYSGSNDSNAIDSKKSVLEIRKGNLLKYINYSQVKSYENEQFKNVDSELQMKLMFLHFFYLNERSIILRVMDKHDYRKPDLEGDLNDRYISAYNSFHVSPTFCDMVKLHSLVGIKYFRAKHRFDSHWYCIKISSYNNDEIQTLSKSSRLLQNEIMMLSRLSHENIIQYFSSWIEYQTIYEQLEYNKFGSLEEALNVTINDKIETRVLTLKSSKELVLQIGSALDFMHTDWTFVHNDVNFSNVLLFPADSKKTDVEKETLFECLFEKTSFFDILFKLAGFENCELVKESHDFNRDVQDLATIAAESIGEDPVNWKYTSPTKSISIKHYSDNGFVLILMDAVLGHIKCARQLLELVEHE